MRPAHRPPPHAPSHCHPASTETTTQRTTFIDQLAPLPPIATNSSTHTRTARTYSSHLPTIAAITLHSRHYINRSLAACLSFLSRIHATPPLVFTASSPDSHHQWLEGALRRVQDIICQHILNIEAAAPPATPHRIIHTSHSHASPQPQSSSVKTSPSDADGGGIARVTEVTAASSRRPV